MVAQRGMHVVFSVAECAKERDAFPRSATEVEGGVCCRVCARVLPCIIGYQTILSRFGRPVLAQDFEASALPGKCVCQVGDRLYGRMHICRKAGTANLVPASGAAAGMV